MTNDVHVRDLVRLAQEDGARVVGSWAEERLATPVANSLNGQPESDSWYVPASALSTDAAPPPWLVEGLLRPGISFVGAEPKSGKTWASLEIAIALASQGSEVDAFGRFLAVDPGFVLYVVEEGTEQEIAWRIRALCRGHDIDPPANLFVAAGRHVLLDDKMWQRRILEAARGFRVIVFDPLVRMHTANEDRAESMRPVNSFLRTLAYTGCSVLVNHHWTKPSESNKGARLGNRMRGTGDFWALCDSILYLSRVKGTPEVAVESEHRSALEEPAWSFTLPTEQDPESVRLEWCPGGVEEIKAAQRAPAVLKAIEGAGMIGITRSDLKVAVGGRPVEVDAAADWLATQGQIQIAKEQRPDKAGRKREQVVFRCV